MRTLGNRFPLRNSDAPCARITAARLAPSPAGVPRGLEPQTLRLLAVGSDQLSYETLWKGRKDVPYQSIEAMCGLEPRTLWLLAAGVRRLGYEDLCRGAHAFRLPMKSMKAS